MVARCYDGVTHKHNDGMQWNRFVTSSRLLHHGFQSRRIKPNQLSYCARNISFQGTATRTFASSQNPRQPPKLSRRGRADLFFIITGALGSWLYLRDSDWDRDAWNEKERLLDSALRVVLRDEAEAKSPPEASNDDLPLPLRKYLETVMASVPKANHIDSKTLQERVQIASVDQTGMFFASQQWYPFNSTILTKTALYQDDYPGFVWEADVTIMGMPNRVLETYIEGKGSIITKAWGKVPLIQVEEEEPYILFWLAMAPLIPSTFAAATPNNSERLEYNQEYNNTRSLITWNSVQDLSTCSGTMVDRVTHERFEMELQFDPATHLLQSIKVTSPCLQYPWQVQYSNYQELAGGNKAPTRRSGVFVPCQIEVGKWKNDGHLELHLKITNQHVRHIPLGNKASRP